MHPDRPAIVNVVAIEVTATVDERTDHGRVQHSGPATRPVERPVLAVDVEQPQREAATTQCREDDLVNVAAAAEDGLAGRRTRERLPVGTPDKQLLEPPVHDVPRADKEVEVVHADHRVAGPLTRPVSGTTRAGRRTVPSREPTVAG